MPRLATYFFLLFIFLFLPSCQFKTNTNQFKAGIGSLSSSGKVISKLMQDQVDSWNNGSIDGYMQAYLHSDALKFITRKGVRQGFDSVTYHYKKSYNSKEKMGRLSFRQVSFSPIDLPESENIINATGKWFVSHHETTDSGFFSLIWKQVGGEWKIIIDHTW